MGDSTSPPPLTRSARERLAEIGAGGLHRRMRLIEGKQGPRVTIDGRELLLLCSNNYLGLAEHPEVRRAGAEAYRDHGAGSGSSRLVSGNMAAHEELERRLADFHEQEAALLFGSGYLANTGVISALARRGEVVYSDALNHASIIDGCRLAGAAKFIYRHGDLDHLDWALKRCSAPASLIVTDGLFSMDGDVAPLSGLVELARDHGARLLVDEAHAVGTQGPGGRGTIAAEGLAGEVELVTATLGKSLGSYGAYVATSEELRELLVNTARPLIFSTGLPPASALAAQKALEIVEREPERIDRLRANADLMREALRAEGLQVGSAASQIIPVMIGEPERAVEACAAAIEQGVYAQAIRPPTVPDGTSRLRVTVMASHAAAELERAAQVIGKAVAGAGGGSEAAIAVPESTADDPDQIRITDARRPAAGAAAD